jgi:hypothetical protein
MAWIKDPIMTDKYMTELLEDAKAAGFKIFHGDTVSGGSIENLAKFDQLRKARYAEEVHTELNAKSVAKALRENGFVWDVMSDTPNTLMRIIKGFLPPPPQPNEQEGSEATNG